MSSGAMATKQEKKITSRDKEKKKKNVELTTGTWLRRLSFRSWRSGGGTVLGCLPIRSLVRREISGESSLTVRRRTLPQSGDKREGDIW